MLLLPSYSLLVIQELLEDCTKLEFEALVAVIASEQKRYSKKDLDDIYLLVADKTFPLQM